ncbi:MAG: hypothetical protein IPJ39_21950 [Saprospiraceae bacterium]|nr:hypothetical protein [Saprospiraceae bacterium]
MASVSAQDRNFAETMLIAVLKERDIFTLSGIQIPFLPELNYFWACKMKA